MEDQEIEQKIEELIMWMNFKEETYHDGKSLVTTGRCSKKSIVKMMTEIYSLGQSHMKQKAIDCVPEEEKFIIGMNYEQTEYLNGFNECREQILSALKEI